MYVNSKEKSEIIKYLLFEPCKKFTYQSINYINVWKVTYTDI